MKDKRILKIILSMSMALCIAFCLFTLNVYADQNDIYYLANQIDFDNVQAINYNSTYNNYLLNYDTVDGYLKEDINNTFDNAWTGYNFLSNDFLQSYPNFIEKWVYSSQNNYTSTTSGAFNFAGIEVPQIVVNGDYIDQSDIKYLICINQNNNNYAWNIYIYSIYVPAGTKCWLQQGRLFASDNTVYLSGKVLGFIYDENKDYLEFTNYDDIATNNSYYTRYDYDNDNNYDLYQYYTNFDYWFYSDLPVYYIYQDHTNGNGAYLNQSPYFFGDYNATDINSLGKYILNDDDDTGFVVDRRVVAESQNEHLNENIGVMQGSFNVLYGGADLDNHKLLVAYNLNDYTSSIQNTVQLKINYQLYVNGQYQNNEFLFDGDYNTSNNMFDSYDINNSNYVYIDMKSVFDKIYGEDTVAGDYGLNSIFQIINGTNFNQRFYTANEFLKTVNKIGGFSLEQRKNSDYYYANSYWSNFFENIGDKAIDFLNQGFTEKAIKLTYNTSKQAVYDNAYLLVTMYLYNNSNGDYSNSYIYKYNYLDGSVESAGGFESEDEQFNGYFPTNNGGTGSYQSANNSAYGGSNNIELNVGLGSIPYLLVDIPENEWLNKTPNLKNILNDYKTMLAEVKDDSILSMMPATYSYLPAPLWQYITYGVGFLVMVGIWRAITRR